MVRSPTGSRSPSMSGSRPSSCASVRLSPVVARSRPPSALNFIKSSSRSDEGDDDRRGSRRSSSSPTVQGVPGLSPANKEPGLSREQFRKRALEHLRSEIWPLPRSPARWWVSMARVACTIRIVLFRYFARFKLRVWWVDGRLARQPYRPTVIAVLRLLCCLGAEKGGRR